ncbi:MAG: preprotein translocase subunit SecG [Rubrobacteraceae bacterium]
MIYVIAFVHALLCISIIGLILLHSGKGGGLSSSLGGGVGSTFSGTSIMEKNLTRLTLGAVALFALTSVLLIFLA